MQLRLRIPFESILPGQKTINILLNGTGTTTDRIDRFVPLQFPQKWRDENPNYLEKIPRTQGRYVKMHLILHSVQVAAA